MRVARVTYATILTGTILWCAGFILAPVLVASSGPFVPIGEFLYQVFRPICHQIDHRSFHILGVPLAVCSRCSSIYIAFLGGVMVYPFLRRLDTAATPPRWILAAALVPMLLDVGAGLLGIYITTFETRAVTGAIFGLVIPFFVLPAAVEAVGQITSPSSNSFPNQKGIIDA